jgi:hypothetical protein
MRTIKYATLSLIMVSLCCVIQISACTPYTYDQSDTPENKRGFERHFGLAPSPDVIELYYYADELGIDTTYQLGFRANRSTIDRIVSDLDLEQMDKEFEDLIAREFPWWKKTDLKNLRPYWKRSADGQLFKYLWYDEKKQQAWYLEYSV